MSEAGGREQVARLLALVPYLHQAGEVRVGEAAAAMGVSPAQVVRDLKVLFFCGLPGGYPDDLIDVDLDALEGSGRIEDGLVRVSNADYLARPVRFAPSEATAILVALRSLAAEQPEVSDVVARTLAKLEGALELGQGAPGAGQVHVETAAPDVDPQIRRAVEDAVAQRHQLQITYYVPSRDEESQRRVDPRAVVVVDDVAYLDGWCHVARDDRTFRLDRIQAATVLDEPVGERAREPRNLTGSWFEDEEHAARVTLRLEPEAAWVPEYYAVDDVRPLTDGALEVDLRVGSETWLRRLLLRLAPHARVVSPPALNQMFTESAQRARNLYP